MKSARPIKALHIIDSFGMGGAETWLMEMLRLWSTTGAVRTDFLLTSGNRSLFDDEARRLGAKLHYVRFGRARVVQFTTEFRRILREGQYDVLHDHANYASGWHFLLGLGALPPVRVIHIHNSWSLMEAHYAVTSSRRLASAAGKRLVHHLATHVGGTSADILIEYGFDLGRNDRPAAAVLYCGFDVGNFNAPREPDRQSVLGEFAWPRDANVVLFVGRLDRTLELHHPQNQKNSWLALNIARVALVKNPAVRLLMAGAGDEARTEMERRVREWGLHEKLRLIGVRQDISRLMRAADVLLFPSAQEGLGMVAVEAQAACLPVLASTAVPREAVVVAQLYDALSLDDPLESWADALLRSMAKPRLPLDVGRRALEVSAFSITNSARQLEAIYRSGLR